MSEKPTVTSFPEDRRVQSIKNHGTNLEQVAERVLGEGVRLPVRLVPNESRPSEDRPLQTPRYLQQAILVNFYNRVGNILDHINEGSYTITALIRETVRHALAQAAQEEWSRLDDLTGLAPKGAAERALEQIIHTGSEAKNAINKYSAVIMIDLDKFKIINDSKGHAAGDFALKEVAKKLCETFREEDVIVRHGGDEFVVVINSINHERPEDIIANMFSRLSATYVYFDNDSEPLKLDFSCGAVIFSLGTIKRDINPAEIIEFADSRAAYIKRTGRKGIAISTFGKTDALVLGTSRELGVIEDIEGKLKTKRSNTITAQLRYVD